MSALDLLAVASLATLALFWLLVARLMLREVWRWLDRRFLLSVRWPIRKEMMWRGLAWKLPHKLVTWAAIRVFAHATTGQYGDTNVCQLGAMDALDRWRGD